MLEHLIAAAPTLSQASFYRTQDGAEIDLLLEFAGLRIAIEIKRSGSSKPAKGFHTACQDVAADLCWRVHGDERSFPLGNHVQALSLPDALASLAAMRG